MIVPAQIIVVLGLAIGGVHLVQLLTGQADADWPAPTLPIMTAALVGGLFLLYEFALKPWQRDRHFARTGSLHEPLQALTNAPHTTRLDWVPKVAAYVIVLMLTADFMWRMLFSAAIVQNAALEELPNALAPPAIFLALALYLYRTPPRQRSSKARSDILVSNVVFAGVAGTALWGMINGSTGLSTPTSMVMAVIILTAICVSLGTLARADRS